MLPKARVVYCSATGVSEVKNLVHSFVHCILAYTYKCLHVAHYLSTYILHVSMKIKIVLHSYLYILYM